MKDYLVCYFVVIALHCCMQILSGKIWIKMNSIEKGITQIVTQHGVKWLVMGAAAEKYYTKYGYLFIAD